MRHRGTVRNCRGCGHSGNSRSFGDNGYRYGITGNVSYPEIHVRDHMPGIRIRHIYVKVETETGFHYQCPKCGKQIPVWRRDWTRCYETVINRAICNETWPNLPEAEKASRLKAIFNHYRVHNCRIGELLLTCEKHQVPFTVAERYVDWMLAKVKLHMTENDCFSKKSAAPGMRIGAGKKRNNLKLAIRIEARHNATKAGDKVRRALKHGWVPKYRPLGPG